MPHEAEVTSSNFLFPSPWGKNSLIIIVFSIKTTTTITISYYDPKLHPNVTKERIMSTLVCASISKFFKCNM